MRMLIVWAAFLTLLLIGLILVISFYMEKSDSTSDDADLVQLFDLDMKIMNGYVADMDTVKHQVSLRCRLMERRGFGYGHICGGSLIAQHVVLSAAHCFMTLQHHDPTQIPFLDASEFVVAMGNLNRFHKEDSLYIDLLTVVTPAETFNATNHADDIAMLFLRHPVPPYLKHIQPIKLNYQLMTDGVMCTASGWGQDENGHTVNRLLSVDVPFISWTTCRAKTLYHAYISPGMICAGYLVQGEKDACLGDSGGPLVCNGTLTGIVSWGSKCGEPFKPGVYTDVLYYRRWIEANLEDMAKFYSKNSSHRSRNLFFYFAAFFSYFASCF